MQNTSKEFVYFKNMPAGYYNARKHDYFQCFLNDKNEYPGISAVHAANVVFGENSLQSCCKAFIDVYHEMKCIHNDYDCSEKMLQRLGFILQESSFVKGQSCSDLLHYLENTFDINAAAVVLMRRKDVFHFTDYIAMVPDESGKWCVHGADPEVCNFEPNRLYLRFADNKDHSLNPAKEVPFQPLLLSPVSSFKETETAVFDSLNPLSYSARDCVIRAVGGVYGCSWDEAVDLLAQFCQYKRIILNRTNLYTAMLKKSGMVQHDFHGTLGDLCRYLTEQMSDKTFRVLGRTENHAVAILPETAKGKTIYRVHDTYDSSNMECIYYWTYEGREDAPLPVCSEFPKDTHQI